MKNASVIINNDCNRIYAELRQNQKAKLEINVLKIKIRNEQAKHLTQINAHNEALKYFKVLGIIKSFPFWGNALKC